MAASPRSSAPTSLSYIALVTWGTLTWKPLWQRKEQVIPSRNKTETGKVVWSSRTVGDSLCSLSTRISPWGRWFLQAQWPPPGTVWWCRTKCIFSWLWACLPGLEFTAAQVISITRVMNSIQFENTDAHYRRGIPYFGQVSKSLEGLYWRWLTGNHITTGMATSRKLLGVGVFSPIFFHYMQCPTGNSEYWRLLVYSQFDFARSTSNQNNSITNISLTCILSLL